MNNIENIIIVIIKTNEKKKINLYKRIKLNQVVPTNIFVIMLI